MDRSAYYSGTSKIIRRARSRVVEFSLFRDERKNDEKDYRFVQQPKLGVGLIFEGIWEQADKWGRMPGSVQRMGVVDGTPHIDEIDSGEPLMDETELERWYRHLESDPLLEIDVKSGVFMGGAADLWWDGAVARGWQFWFGRTLTSNGPDFTEIVGMFGSAADERDRTRIARFEAAVARVKAGEILHRDRTEIAPGHFARPSYDTPWFCEILF